MTRVARLANLKTDAQPLNHEGQFNQGAINISQMAWIAYLRPSFFSKNQIIFH